MTQLWLSDRLRNRSSWSTWFSPTMMVHFTLPGWDIVLWVFSDSFQTCLFSPVSSSKRASHFQSWSKCRSEINLLWWWILNCLEIASECFGPTNGWNVCFYNAPILNDDGEDRLESCENVCVHVTEMLSCCIQAHDFTLNIRNDRVTQQDKIIPAGFHHTVTPSLMVLWY